MEDYIEKIYGKGKILHLVPTFILFQRRANFYRDVLKTKNIYPESFYKDYEKTKFLMENNIFLFELNRFYQYLVKNCFPKEKVLKRRESIVILDRVLRMLPETDHFVWRAAVGNIYSFFQRLSISGVKIEELKDRLDDPSLALLTKVYYLYLEEVRKEGCKDFGVAIRESISKFDFSIFQEIYLDGAFLPIDGGLHEIINNIHKNNGKIKFFIPFDLGQKENPVFRVLKKTYEPYISFDQWKCINEKIEKHNVVQKLARLLFTEEKIEIDDNSFAMMEFETAEEEISAVVHRITELIKKRIVDPKKVAIVSPKPMELRPYVRELAELYKLPSKLPDRPIIQLPAGRFIYLLYQIYTDERIEIFNESDHYVDADMVSEIIHINIIKNSQNIFPIYEKIKSFFDDCKTFQQWKDQLEHLIAARKRINDSFKYHPLYFISDEQLQEIKSMIVVIENLSSKIIHSEKMSFLEHLNTLIAKLQEEKQILNIDQESIDRFINIVETVQEENNLLIDVKEFARLIQSLFKDEKNDENEQDEKVEIRVTGPNNVEYQKYDYIYFTRFTQSKYPEEIFYDWPMNLELDFNILNSSTNLGVKDSQDLFHYYLDRSLYYLFIVINSVEKKMTISYSKKENGIEQSISHYVHDIAKVFGFEEDVSSNKDITRILVEKKFLSRPTQQPTEYDTSENKKLKGVLLKEDMVLTIEDFAIYDYCPRRFYYEKKYPEKKVYTSRFQLENYGAACLYEEMVKLLVKKFPEISKRNKDLIKLSFDEIFNEARKTLYDFFPFDHSFWETIKLRTELHLKTLIDSILKNTDHRIAKVSLNGQSVTESIDGYKIKGERELKVQYPTITHYYPISNLKTLLSFSANKQNKKKDEELQYIKTEYIDLLREFCYQKEEAENKIKSYTKKISEGIFEKNSGGHCIYCVFNDVCMEKEVQ